MMLTGQRIYSLQRCKYVTGSFLLGFGAGLAVSAQQHDIFAENSSRQPVSLHNKVQPFSKRINFVDTKAKRRTANPPGWEEYDGSVYTKERGYGWVAELTGFYAADGVEHTTVLLPGGRMTSPRKLGRLELASCRDGIYTYIAKNRFRWFGTQNRCRVLAPHEPRRFI